MAVDRRSVLAGMMAAAARAPAACADPAEGDMTVLEARPGTLALKPGHPTAIWGYGGEVPGPVLRVKKGADVRVRLVNKLIQPTTLCWHGVRISNGMDGVGGLTQASVPPGGSFDYRFTPPDSGLFWVHPHVWPLSAEQIGRGLAAVLIVEEAAPPKADDDILLVLDDWSLDAKGQIRSAAPDDPSRAAPLLTVNGRLDPVAATVRPGARLRLRFLNIAAARVALVRFDGCEATIIAIDGQPSEAFRPAHAMIPIGPGARFEVMVDVPPAAGKTARLVLHGETVPDRDLMVVVTKGAPVAAYPPVAKLPDNPLLPTRIPLELSVRHELVVDRVPPKTAAPWLWSLGGEPSDGFSGKPLFAVKRGATVTLTLVNETNELQQMHLHGHVVRLLHDLDDGWDPYWRDCVLLGPGKTKHVAFIADNPGKWAIESSMLDRQVTGMAGWFEVA